MTDRHDDIFKPHGHEHFPHHDPFVKETAKVAEITDQFGHTRYRVSLTDFDRPSHIDLNKYSTMYQVEVWCYFIDQDPIRLVSENFDIYDLAVAFYKKNVESYTALVKAETRKMQSVWMFADKIGYHRICPDCCVVCKHAKKICGMPHDFQLECTHGMLLKEINRQEFDDGCIHDKDRCAVFHEHSYLPLHPRVDCDGICKFFERRKDEKEK